MGTRSRKFVEIKESYPGGNQRPSAENLCGELEEERFGFDMSTVVLSVSPEGLHSPNARMLYGEKLLVGCIISRKFHADIKTAELLRSFFGAGIGPLRGLGCLPSHLVRCAFKTGLCPSAPIGLGVRADLRKLLGMVQKS